MELIGNKDIFLQLRIAAESAATENRSLPHMLLTGAAGCGKTSTARYVATTTGSDFMEIVTEGVKTRDDALALRDQLNKEGYNTQTGDKTTKIRPTIVFIDEIHRLSNPGQEHLGIMMENWIIPVEKKEAKVSYFGGFGLNPEGRGRWCPRFTLIGATTNDGLLTKPFKDRFKFRFVFNTYNLEEAKQIVIAHAADLEGVDITERAIIEIAQRGRGVPRILVTLLERCRDSTVSTGTKTINRALAQMTFSMMKVDPTGLTQVDINIMKALFEANDPIGLDNLAIISNESSKVITETIEPYMIQQGLIKRIPKGRVLTNKGREYLILHNHVQGSADCVDIPLTYKRRI